MTWVVLAAPASERTRRARALRLPVGTGDADVRVLGSIRESFLPYHGGDVKEAFEALKDVAPDLVFTHAATTCTRTTGSRASSPGTRSETTSSSSTRSRSTTATSVSPNVFVPLDDDIVDEKLRLLAEHFPARRIEHWFDEELFRGLLRIRGMESATRYAEAFTCRKLSLLPQ